MNTKPTETTEARQRDPRRDLIDALTSLLALCATDPEMPVPYCQVLGEIAVYVDDMDATGSLTSAERVARLLSVMTDVEQEMGEDPVWGYRAIARFAGVRVKIRAKHVTLESVDSARADLAADETPEKVEDRCEADATVGLKVFCSSEREVTGWSCLQHADEVAVDLEAKYDRRPVRFQQLGGVKFGRGCGDRKVWTGGAR